MAGAGAAAAAAGAAGRGPAKPPVERGAGRAEGSRGGGWTGSWGSCRGGGAGTPAGGGGTCTAPPVPLWGPPLVPPAITVGGGAWGAPRAGWERRYLAVRFARVGAVTLLACLTWLAASGVAGRSVGVGRVRATAPEAVAPARTSTVAPLSTASLPIAARPLAIAPPPPPPPMPSALAIWPGSGTVPRRPSALRSTWSLRRARKSSASTALTERLSVSAISLQLRPSSSRMTSAERWLNERQAGAGRTSSRFG